MTGTVIVEQLNRSQWHASLPDGRGTGVGDWVETVADALTVACLYEWAVESVDLDHHRRLLMHAEPLWIGGAR